MRYEIMLVGNVQYFFFFFLSILLLESPKYCLYLRNTIDVENIYPVKKV